MIFAWVGGRPDSGGLFEDIPYLRSFDIEVDVVHGVKQRRLRKTFGRSSLSFQDDQLIDAHRLDGQGVRELCIRFLFVVAAFALHLKGMSLIFLSLYIASSLILVSGLFIVRLRLKLYLGP